MENLRFSGKDKVPVVAEINTLDEFKRFVFSYSYKFDEETPDEFKQIPLASDSSTNYARFYRGHSHVDYCLQSTLERYLEKFGKQIDIKKDYERLQEKYFENCKRILINQSIDGYILLPSNLKDDDIWTFAQHYQLKTPLLDWTKSFFVALYFAFESQEENKKENEYRVIYELNEFFNFGKKLIVEPEIKIGNRINAQKGVFTKLSSIEFEDIAKMNTKFGNGHVFHRLSKMLISSKLRKDVLAYLASINIDASTIYPDLLGKIKSCELGIDNAIAEINLEYQD
ncbi:TPA: FRG domain-containing protein [Haemophilus influenzae]|uniref:FRG domain-containing protein n=1 Tax=Haemophilus influenzae TaxID=727 RepID=UPI000A4B73F9|nr:FRG domain-containing protein [Haemophilus influenzae]MCK8790983.1 FRG domain-containing protein [Haemophilus influenzae]MCK9024560.1 FRG domain-containing protein [Haemophilus influenzae]